MAAAARALPLLLASAVGAAPIRQNYQNSLRAKAHSDASSRTVILIRHCPRAVSSTTTPSRSATSGGATFDYLENYTSHGAYEWGVPPYFCTVPGMSLAGRIGESLSTMLSEQPDTTPTADFVADETERTAVTMYEIARSFSANSTRTINHWPFGTACGDVPTPLYTQSHLNAYRNFTTPEELARVASLTSALQKFLGDGVAPRLPNVTNFLTSSGGWGGQAYLSSELAEAFIMQMASGFRVGNVGLSAEQVHNFSALVNYYASLEDEPLAIERNYDSRILISILDRLVKPDTPQLSIFVGHDLNIQALSTLLEAAWEPTPWPPLAVPPLSMIRFRATGETVELDFLYSRLDGPKDSTLLSVPVYFKRSKEAGGATTTPTLKELLSRAKERMDVRCI